MAKKRPSNVKKILISGRRAGKKSFIAGEVYGKSPALMWIDEAEEISPNIYKKIWEGTVADIPSPPMTAREAEERIRFRGMDSREAEEHWRRAPRIIRDHFHPMEYLEMLRMGRHPRDIEMEAMDRERRRDRGRRREMEMMTNPPVMATSDIFAREFGERLRTVVDRQMFAALGLEEEEKKSKFPEYTDEKFDNMGKEPVVKEIMPGAVMLTKEQRADRIKLYLEDTK